GIAVLGTTAGFVVGDYCQQKARLEEKNAQEEIRSLQHLQTMLLHAQSHQQNYFKSAKNPERLQEDYNHLIEHINEFNQAWATFKASYENPKKVNPQDRPGELALFKRIVTTNDPFVKEYFQRTVVILKQMTSPTLKSEERENARQKLLNSSDSALDDKVENLIDTLTDLIHFADKEYEQSRAEAIAADQIRLRIITGSILFSVAIAIILAIYTSRAIARPIQATTKVAQQVTQDKNFNLQALVTTEDEVADLTISLNQLILQVNQLLEAQKTANYSQLIHQEKMSSLGRMIAGVAHEISDPVNFIYGNSAYASEYIKDLLSLLETYTSEIPYPPPAVQLKLEETDFNFIKKDLLQVLHSMNSGAQRIAQIILSLKDFSRLDEAIAHPVDLHACIDSTLLILDSRIKRNITVIRNYGNIPEIKGYGSLLYQVFMNLLSNAIDALEEVKNEKQITIATELENENCVVVKITDNGSGISPENQAKIFDAFFTTKSTGVATGLGLAISHQIIVEKHGGKITCNSQVGVGTEFAIALRVVPEAFALPSQQQSLGYGGLDMRVSQYASTDWTLGTQNRVPEESRKKKLPA
ncbi:sensor histidine kinase, partial [Allocoleopsis sp.]|uniref:sensor histidine kinase n=1 Tax=Allocoleopsis sp. TaxID=3088169 RepID=UPI002FD71FCA